MRGCRIALLLFLAAAGATPGAAEEIEELFESALPESRERAAALLGEQGDTAAAKKLIALLDDRDWGVQMAALRALGPIRYGPGRDAMREKALDGPIRAIRVLAAVQLRDHDGGKEAARIARGLTRLKKEARLPAIEALGIIGTDEAVEALAGQLRAPEPEHRVAAARALIRASGPAAEKALARALKDKEEAVRLLAAIALAGVDTDHAREEVLDFVAKIDPTEGYVLRRVGWRGAAANRDALAAALDRRVAKSRQPGAYLHVAVAGGLEVPSAREHFRNSDGLTRAFAYRAAAAPDRPLPLADVERGLGDREASVRHAAAEAALRGAKAPPVDAVVELLGRKEPEAVMIAVRRAVEGVTKEALPALVLLAQGKTPAAKKDWRVRVAACVAVGRIGLDQEFDALAALARTRDWEVRAAAYEALYHAHDKRAIPILIAAFNDRQPVARMTARRNLRYLTGQHLAQQKMYESWWEKVRDTIELEHPGKRLEELDKYGYSTRKYLQEILRGTDIVAIKGRWDKVELILEDLQVRHMAVRAQQIKDYGVSPKQVVLVNCEGSMDSRTTRFLQWMVVAGGYMATTDWSLVNATTKTFPDVVKGYVRQSTGNDVVVVEPGAPDHPTLKGVFHEHVDLKWWLEIQAFPIAIEDPVRCTVLVDSLEMLVRYGSSAMMVEWTEGLGKVLHSTSHFYLQKEGFAHASNVEERKVFAADHLGLTPEDIRELDAKAAFNDINNTTPISRSYSMFHLLVNFINEKQKRDLQVNY